MDLKDLENFARASVRAYDESLRRMGDKRNDGTTGRMQARDVTMSAVALLVLFATRQHRKENRKP